MSEKHLYRLTRVGKPTVVVQPNWFDSDSETVEFVAELKALGAHVIVRRSAWPGKPSAGTIERRKAAALAAARNEDALGRGGLAEMRP